MLHSAAAAMASSMSHVLESVKLTSTLSVYSCIWVIVCLAHGVVSVAGGEVEVGVVGLSELSPFGIWGPCGIAVFVFSQLLSSGSCVKSVGSMLGLQLSDLVFRLLTPSTLEP